MRKVFVDAGVKGEDYDAAWNSFVVRNHWLRNRRKPRLTCSCRGVPAMFVNSKYQINPQGMDTSGMDVLFSGNADTGNIWLIKIKNADYLTGVFIDIFNLFYLYIFLIPQH
ncbi:hypothetical protein KCP69_02150 [Salmonella enterica subsp. enterica]|nr:hypothetical protein KCP69_02150 [Salmonella enterica subsp. enterica]